MRNAFPCTHFKADYAWRRDGRRTPGGQMPADRASVSIGMLGLT